MKKLIAFFKEEDGLELSEYAVMGALIILGLSAIIVLLAGSIGGVFTDMTTAISARPGA